MQRMRKISMFDEINKDKMSKETEPAIYDKFAQVEVKKKQLPENQQLRETFLRNQMSQITTVFI